jgi:hypothetical protein
LSFPRIKFQITTRGKEISVVKRGITSIAKLAESSSLIESNIELLIVTDESSEIPIFIKHIEGCRISFPTQVINVPKDYKTPNSTVLKARGLQYSIEHRKSNSLFKTENKQRSFIFYFDAESTISDVEFRRVLHSIITAPEKRIFQGAIVYPHKYFQANIISRQMEAVRPFNCHHCIQVMKKPPPLHMHGSNLLVEENLVNSIGWDFGRLKNQPLLAEDLLFGLKVYIKYGGKPFGWHGGLVHEQPPFNIRESLHARMRWITGAWQALLFLKTQPDFLDLPVRFNG